MTGLNYEILPALLTLGSFGLLLYAYGAYPGLLWLLSRVVRPDDCRRGQPTSWPAVSILLSAYNEEQVIAERLGNLLALDYPLERLEILVGSDGSMDRTCEIVNMYEAQGIRLVAFEQRRGKASVLNDLMTRARGEIVILTDANTFFHPQAVRELIKALWRYPSACAVVGRLDLRSSIAAGNLDGPYWRYETWLKTLESRFGSVLGANGAIYAFRRERYQLLPQNAIVDDFLIPMLMRLRSGGNVFFVPTARAWETSPERVRDEFRRRVRIGAGDLQALIWTWRLLLPWKGMVALAYFSHKVLRWLGPWLMLMGFGANLWSLGTPFFRVLFIGQLGLYGLGIGAALIRHVPILGAAASGVRYFLVLNAALLLGFARFALGIERPFWSTAPRRG
jgi:cellulose synthase/poly-beta-1,6-N-acetylglucosamine synthase-like glycosyltransferase